LSARHALLSDTGLERERNEDAGRVDAERGVYAIADGMGGHLGGDLASRTAIEAVFDALQRCEQLDSDALARALQAANRAVLRTAAERGLPGMGTTLTLIALGAGQLHLAHVGDTRAYLVGPDGLQQLSVDHTLVSVLVAEGLLREEAARDHPERHVLVQALGIQDELEPQQLSRELAPGSRILLSSDGLHDLVDPAVIARLARGDDLEAAARALIDAANAAGGSDNITVLLIQT
jgi:serine/threonine protein phosphatase PrpC